MIPEIKKWLKRVLFAEWNEIQKNVTESLLKSMLNGFKAILKMKGYVTKY